MIYIDEIYHCLPATVWDMLNSGQDNQILAFHMASHQLSDDELFSFCYWKLSKSVYDYSKVYFSDFLEDYPQLWVVVDISENSSKLTSGVINYLIDKIKQGYLLSNIESLYRFITESNRLEYFEAGIYSNENFVMFSKGMYIDIWTRGVSNCLYKDITDFKPFELWDIVKKVSLSIYAGIDFRNVILNWTKVIGDLVQGLIGSKVDSKSVDDFLNFFVKDWDYYKISNIRIYKNPHRHSYITIDELMDILKYSEMSRRDIRFVMERWNRFKKDGIRIKSKSSIYFCCNSDYHLGCSV